MISLSRTSWTCPRSPIQLCRRWRSQPSVPRTRSPSRSTSPVPIQYTGINYTHLRTGLTNGDHAPTTSFGLASSRHNYRMLESVVMSRLNGLLKEMGPWKASNMEYRSYGLESHQDLERETELFRKSIRRAFKHASDFAMVSRRENPLFWNLRNAFVRADTRGLTLELKYAFQSCMLRNAFPKYITERHQQIADLRYPYEWFPATRMMQRTVHLHVGPTNSGKTYNALKALESARTGIYAGPLRLLAHEVYSRFTAKGLPCALITGEELRIPEGVNQYFRSCTVEMSPLNERVDVAVIDEIQMIADPERGWAWTQAFLGIQAKELHLCGEERAVDIIRDICARLGDKCIVHRYERLNPLHFMKDSLKGDFNNLRTGDAVVSFTRVGLHSLKAGIEEKTGKRCAIVYGSLPPETRAQQAALFNEPDNEYEILVASDAIGMGLNLEIKRVVFESASKFDGSTHRLLTVPEVKQIGGRAGRYRSASQAIKAGPPVTVPGGRSVEKWGTPGFVTALEDEDLELLADKFDNVAEPIDSVGIASPNFIIERFASFFPPNTPFAFILSRLREMGRVSKRFQLCDMGVAIKIAEVIQQYPMSIEDRCIFLTAPVSTNVPDNVAMLSACARCVADNMSVSPVDVEEIDLEILDVDRTDGQISDADYLHRLETLHKNITLYLWLSYRYRGVFLSQHLAFHIKELVEQKITDYLNNLSFVPKDFELRRSRARRLAERHKKEQEAALGQMQTETDFSHEGQHIADEVEQHEGVEHIAPAPTGEKAESGHARV